MKKIYMIIALLAIGTIMQVNAQTVAITFNIDMTAQAGNLTGGVFVIGTFHTKGHLGFGADYTTHGAPLAQVGSSNIYTITVDSLVPTSTTTTADSLTFKFLFNNGSADTYEGQASGSGLSTTCPTGGTGDGFGGHNRQLSVPSGDAEYTAKWDSCGTLTLTAGINEVKAIPYFNISPNPAYNNATINYGVGVNGNARLEVYNTIGQLVNVNFNQAQTAGSYTNTLDVSNLSTGIYFVKLTVGDNFKVTKLNVVR